MQRALWSLTLVAASLVFALEASAQPEFGTFGLDLASEDSRVNPGDDFFRFADGRWLQRATIPPDRSSWGVFDALTEQATADVKSIVQHAAAAQSKAGTDQQKVGDFYHAFLDTNRIEALGLLPARAGLAAIDRLKTHAQVAALIANPRMPVDGPIAIGIRLDAKNPDRYVVTIRQSGLSLPDREYYLKSDAEFVELRKKFVAHAQRMLALAGYHNASSAAEGILALETEIAKLHWEIAKRRERDLTYNLVSVEALVQAAEYPWAAAFKSADVGDVKEVVVAEWSAMGPLARLFRSTPVESWRNYLRYQFLTGRASLLPKAFDDEDFDFNGRILNGQPQQSERWKRAVRAVNGALGEAVGKLYVDQHFSPDSKAQMEALVENLRQAYAQHISHVPWMTPETRTAAQEKLRAFRAKIGYPSKWRDYSKLTVKRGDAFGNQERAEVFDWQRRVARLNKPTDRDEWGMTPQTVNAYYNPTFNEIVFPAAILQPPFFDPKADPAVNYGAIGAVIGHEMGHGFDDQGAKSDAKGVLRAWWKAEGVQAFRARTDALVDQYSAYEPIRGLHLNGRLTLGENIGDLGGLSIAHDAYQIFLNGKPASVIEGLTSDQRFFLSWAQACRAVYRQPALRNQILSDPHSPEEFRVNGVVRNIDTWYAAFDIKPGDRLYLPPEQRVRIW